MSWEHEKHGWVEVDPHEIWPEMAKLCPQNPRDKNEICNNDSSSEHDDDSKHNNNSS